MNGKMMTRAAWRRAPYFCDDVHWYGTKTVHCTQRRRERRQWKKEWD